MDCVPLQGIPADDIFNDNYDSDDDLMGVGRHGNTDKNDAASSRLSDRDQSDEEDIAQLRKRRRLEEELEREDEGVLAASKDVL